MNICSAFLFSGLKLSNQAAVTFYHGTSSPGTFTAFKTDLVYMAPNPEEVLAFAENPILGGSRGSGPPHILVIDAKPGRAKDIDDIVQNAVMEEEDLDVVIAREGKRARAEGYRYLSFCHPSAVTDQDFTATVSLYPNMDLTIDTDLIKVYRGITGKETGKYLVTTDRCVARCHGRIVMESYVDRTKLRSGPEEVAFYDGKVPQDKVGSIEAWVREGDLMCVNV